MLSTFPSAKEDNGLTKGGMVLIKVKLSDVSQTKVIVSYKDVEGTPYVEEDVVKFDPKMASKDKSFYSDASIRKAILLVRFVTKRQHGTCLIV